MLIVCRTLAAVVLSCWTAWGESKPAASQPAFSPVVEPEALLVELGRPGGPEGGFVILDVRPSEKYTEAHVQTARHVDLAEWAQKAKSPEEDLGKAVVWRRRIGELGITSASRVIVYDDGPMTEAARLWFILQHFGVTHAAILNGGFAAIRPLLPPEWVSNEPSPPPALASPLEPGGKPSPEVGLVDKSVLKQRLGRAGMAIVDARTNNEYLGKDARGNPRSGHLPGAINLPHEKLIDERGRLKPPDALKEVFAEAGITPRQHLVMHCQSGGRSSLAALAAIQAGYAHVENYYLSFGEWSADESCPVEQAESED